MVKCLSLIENLHQVKFNLKADQILLFLFSNSDFALELIERIENIAAAGPKGSTIVLKKNMLKDILKVKPHPELDPNLADNESLENIENMLFGLEDFLSMDKPSEYLSKHPRNQYFPFNWESSMNRKPNLDWQSYYLILEKFIYTKREKNFRQELYNWKKENGSEIKKAVIRHKAKLKLLSKTVFFKNIVQSKSL